MKNLLMLLALAVSLATSTAPAPQPTGEADAARERLGKLNGEIRSLKALVSTYAGAEGTILGELDRLDRQAELAQRQLDAARARLVIGRTQEESLRQASAELAQQVDRAERLLSGALVRLYKQGSPDWLLVLLGTGNPSELRTSLRYLTRLSQQEEEALASYRALRAEAEAKRTEAASANRELRQLERDLGGRGEAYTKARAAKNERLKTITRKRERSVRAVNELEQAAQGLRSLVLGLPESPRPPEAAPGRDQALPFSAVRRTLPWPVEGKVLRSFGTVVHPRFKTAIRHTGLAIQAPRGEPVKAVHAGTVSFADWFKGFGLLVIVDHGESYYTLYAHLQEAFAKKGDRVKRLEVLGLVGETGSLEGPLLYFEIRKGGEPVDPRRWLSRQR